MNGLRYDESVAWPAGDQTVVSRMPLSRLIATSPTDVGIDPQAMASLFDRVRQEVTNGRVEGCQVAIARYGRLAGCASFGHGGGRPVEDDTLFACFSCTKATGGIAACQLLEEGLLSLEECVADIIPEFGTHGKESVTVRHLVTFTAGFPNPAGNRPGGDNLIVPADFSTSAARCAEFAKWHLAWPPGSKWEYHADSAHWVLMEIVERRTGLQFRDYLRTRILDPAGLTGFWVGIPEEIQQSLHFADVAATPGAQACKNPGPADGRVDWNAPEIRALGLPAGGGWTTAADLALLYQPLLNGGKVFGGGQICKPETIALGTTVLTDNRHVFDGPNGQPIAKLRGVVFELAGNDGDVRLDDGKMVSKNLFRQVGVGMKASTRSFGHGGAGGQIAWGDPESGISMAFVHNSFGPEAQFQNFKLKRDVWVMKCPDIFHWSGDLQKMCILLANTSFCRRPFRREISDLASACASGSARL